MDQIRLRGRRMADPELRMTRLDRETVLGDSDAHLSIIDIHPNTGSVHGLGFRIQVLVIHARLSSECLVDQLQDRDREGSCLPAPGRCCDLCGRSGKQEQEKKNKRRGKSKKMDIMRMEEETREREDIELEDRTNGEMMRQSFRCCQNNIFRKRWMKGWDG